LRLKKARPDEYRLWMRITRLLLETLPLGLTPEHLAVLLKLEHGLDLSGSDVGRFGLLLAGEVAYELKGFLADDTLDVLTERLGVSFGSALRKLSPGEHFETVNAYLRNELLQGRHHSPLWDMIEGAGFAVGEVVLGRLLLHQRGISLGGRLTDGTFCAQVRQREYLLAIDEVVKEVVYALVSRGYELAAVAGPELVLEISGTDSDLPRQVAALIRLAQQPLLGRLAAPAKCLWRDEW
jgi:hypothetical protein